MNEIRIEIVKEYTPEIAAGIGALMPSLSARFDGRPTDEAVLREIIDSPFHVQLIALQGNRVVGAATLSLILSPEPLRNAYLETCVVDANIQGAGIGGKLWDAMIAWCQENNCNNLEFTSNPKRVGAIAFYQKKGAEIYDTNFFRYKIPR